MHFRAAFIASLIGVGLVSGCQHAARNRDIESASQPARRTGYLPERRFATTSVRETWTFGGEPVDVVVLRPPGEGPMPLIVYMPGLGEPPSAGAAWRQTWAEAGYAVLAYQLPAEGESVWASPRARSGDFFELAKGQFSRAALSKRLATLRAVLEEVVRRRGSPALRGVDVSRIALAGFELGAQTAMAAAGETENGAVPFALPSEVRCVIAFSPFADFSGTAFEQRFAAIHVPVLSVTSLQDRDPYGLVDTPSLRRVPFDYMPPGGKYLLSLVGAPHALIAGRETPSADNAASPQDSGLRTPNDEGNPASTGGGGHGRGRRGGSWGGRRRGSSESSTTEGSARRPASQDAWTASLGEVRSVTTAYLDANLRGDAVATEWLAKDARRWLGDEADLITR